MTKVRITDGRDRKTDVAPNLIKEAVTCLNALTHYEQEYGDPFDVAKSVERPLAELAEVLRRIEDGEL